MLTLAKIVPYSDPNGEGQWIRVPDVLGDTTTTRWTDRESSVAFYLPIGYHMVGYEVVGLEYDTAFKMSWLHGLLYDLAWPRFECLQCLGQEYWQGCECAHKDAVAPGVGPEPWRIWARRLWSVVARRSGLYDPCERSW